MASLLVEEVRKRKAHKDISSLEGDERTEAIGNDAADTRAKAAVAQGDMGGTILEKISDANACGSKVGSELGQSLAAWPPPHELYRELAQIARSPKAKQGVQDEQHILEHVDGQIR